MHSTSDNPRQALLTSILQAMPAEDAAAVGRVAIDLRDCLDDQESVKEKVVLVAYGGGKDSSYMTAFVRAVQLYCDLVLALPFRLRVVTNRHAGMPPAVMANIERTYRALGMLADPSADLLVIDGNAASHFAANLTMPPHLIERNRTDILMNGHRFAGEARPTFCNACNLSMVNAFGVAAAWQDGADVIITGDSHREQKAYLVWTRKLARDFDADNAPPGDGLGSFLRTMDGVSQKYFGEIHGAAMSTQGGIAHTLPKASRFFSIYGYTAYDAGAHWDFLIDFLGFAFDELAFSFTESDCANPLLMAHFRGLRSERLYGRSYADGIIEYRDYALRLMAKKAFPAALIETMAARYGDPDAIAHMRNLASNFALIAFRLTEPQIVCMLSAPFGDRGYRLHDWLAREVPALLKREPAIRDLLDAEAAESDELGSVLLELSGLTLDQIRQCWRRSVMPNLADATATTTALGRILRDDPHKATIVTRHAPDGPEVVEVISGR